MMSISTTRDVVVLLQHLDALPAVLGVQHGQPVLLQHAGEREDVADVVVDDQHLLAAEPDARGAGVGRRRTGPPPTRRPAGRCAAAGSRRPPRRRAARRRRRRRQTAATRRGRASPPGRAVRARTRLGRRRSWAVPAAGSPGRQFARAERQVEGERASPGPARSRAWISPPSSRAISRLMDRPRPVPPYLRLVVPSACLNASKITRILLGRDADAGVGHRERDQRRRRRAASRLQQLLPDRLGTSGRPAGSPAPPRPLSVNFTALDSRLRSTCSSRCSSVCSVAGSSGETRTREVQALLRGQRPEGGLHVVDQLDQRDTGRARRPSCPPRPSTGPGCR